MREELELKARQLRDAHQERSKMLERRIGEAGHQISSLDSMFKQSSSNLYNDFSNKLSKQKHMQYVLFGLAILLSLISAFLVAVAILIR
jgi:hypothetical protein